MGSHTDKIGNVIVDTLKKGEYTFGYYDYTVGINNQQPASVEHFDLNVVPNPAKNNCKINFNLRNEHLVELVITDTTGKKIFSTMILPNRTSVDWDCRQQSAGTYIVQLVKNERVIE